MPEATAITRRPSPDAAPPAAREALGPLWLWAALLAALSPTLVEWARVLGEQPSARAAAVFAAAFAVLAWRSRAPAAPAPDGWLWLAAGLAMSFLGVGGGMPRLGRPGIALAAIGLARLTGRPPLAHALVAAWIVPLPSTWVTAFTPDVTGLVADAAARVAPAFGASADVTRFGTSEVRLVAPAGVLALFAGDGGLPLAFAFAGVGWLAAVVRPGASLAAGARRALLGALAAAPVQGAGLAVACAVAIAGAPRAARALLDWLPFAATALGVATALRPPGAPR